MTFLTGEPLGIGNSSGISLPATEENATYDSSASNYGVNYGVDPATANSLEQESLQDPDAPLTGNTTTETLQPLSSVDTTNGLSPDQNIQNAASSLLNHLNPFSTAGSPSLASQASTASQAFFSDLFLRSVVIIIGFIFLAIGLAMFKNVNLNAGQTIVKNAVKPSPHPFAKAATSKLSTRIQ